MSKGQALIIEDEADAMELVQGVLAYYGIDSVGVSNGEDALIMLEGMTPTVMIVDLALPGIDGFTLLKRIQADRRWDLIPRVALTAYHHTRLPEQAIAAGFDAYFAKPIDAVSFADELRAIVGR